MRYTLYTMMMWMAPVAIMVNTIKAALSVRFLESVDMLSIVIMDFLERI